MASLVSHANVWETALQLLRRHGYALTVSLADEEDDNATDQWCATKDGFTFWADNPIELLGLVAVYEDVQPEQGTPYWWAAKTAPERPTLRESIIDEAFAAQEARVAELEAQRENGTAAGR